MLHVLFELLLSYCRLVFHVLLMRLPLSAGQMAHIFFLSKSPDSLFFYPRITFPFDCATINLPSLNPSNPHLFFFII